MARGQAAHGNRASRSVSSGGKDVAGPVFFPGFLPELSALPRAIQTAELGLRQYAVALASTIRRQSGALAASSAKGGRAARCDFFAAARWRH